MRNRGYGINHKNVQKLMKSLGLKGKQRKNEKYHSYKGQVGNISILNINACSKNTTSNKVCQEKAIVWITELWKTFLAD